MHISRKNFRYFFGLIGLSASALLNANPLASAELQDPKFIEKLANSYQTNCSHCHSGDAPSAPRIGASADWAKRLSAGFNHLYDSAIEGIPNTAMQAKGGHTELSNDEIKNLVHYFLLMAKIDLQAIQAAQKYDELQIKDREFIALDQFRLGYLEKKNLSKEGIYFTKFEEYDTQRDGRLNQTEFLNMKADLQKIQRSVKLSDDEIQKNILNALSKVNGMPPAGIRVAVKNGNAVINGVVGDDAVLDRAFKSIRWLPGLQKLDNRLITAEMMAFD